MHEKFSKDVIEAGNSLLVNFERDLIEKDDIEYALDIMTLFNKCRVLRIETSAKILQLEKVMDLVVEEYYCPSSSYVTQKNIAQSFNVKSDTIFR